MAHRELTDDVGTRWQVWSVVPSFAERREADRRTGARDEEDRRIRHEPRVHLEEGFEHGWLAFECGTEKRRLRPIPEGWSDLDDDALLELLRQADRVTRESRS